MATAVLVLALVIGALVLFLRDNADRGGVTSAQAGFAGPAIAIGRGSYDVVEAAGSIWVSQGERGRVLRVNPESGEVVSFEQDSAYPLRMEAGGGAVWVCMSPDELGRIDPATNELLLVEQAWHGTRPTVFTVGIESVWTGAVGRRTIEILDGTDGTPVDRIKLPGPLADIADSDDGAVFVLLQDGTVLSYLESTGDRLGQFSTGGPAWGLEHEDTRLYVAFESSSVVPFETSGERVNATIDTGKGDSYIEVADGRVWVAYNDNRLVRQFDASTGRQLGEPLATGAKPLAVNIGADGRVWLARRDGALVEIRPDGGDSSAPAALRGAEAEPTLSARGTVAGLDEVPATTGEAPGPDAQPAPETAPEPTPEATVEPTYGELVSIGTWWSSSAWDSDTGYVHFKAVDDSGDTIDEVRGSDSVDLSEEMDALAETAERRELVDKLRATLVAAGWTELGVREGGEWYEYEFGR
jgi:streptogramin lyase